MGVGALVAALPLPLQISDARCAALRRAAPKTGEACGRVCAAQAGATVTVPKRTRAVTEFSGLFSMLQLSCMRNLTALRAQRLMASKYRVNFIYNYSEYFNSNTRVHLATSGTAAII